MVRFYQESAIEDDLTKTINYTLCENAIVEMEMAIASKLIETVAYQNS